MPKLTTSLLPSTVPTASSATVVSTDREVAFHVGARTVSWRPPFGLAPVGSQADRSTRMTCEEAARFALDVARATAAATVEDLIALLDQNLPPCELQDNAALELSRAEDALAAAASADHPRSLAVKGAALTFAAALLRLHGVRW